MTSATKILLIEEHPPYAITIQKFLWNNGYLETQIISDDISINTIQQLNPSLIIGTQTAINDIQATGFTFPTIVIDWSEKDLSFEKHLSCPIQQKKILDKLAALYQDATNETNSNFLFIKQDNELHKTAVQDILYLEADGNQVNIYAKTGETYSVHSSLVKMISFLPDACFLRIHKKYIVQICVIDSIQTSNRQIRIKDQVIPFGRTYKDELFSRLKIVH